MVERIPRISVKIITYNQEKVIKRTLDSLIQQKEYIYEICISDDCSKDKTWGILQEYASLYHGFIKLHRNEQNQGIFRNIENSLGLVSGDLVYSLSGDDVVPDKVFYNIVKYIVDNGIDYLNAKISIYGDVEINYPDGEVWYRKNDLVSKNANILRLKIRGLIYGYGVCYSCAIIEKFHKLSQGRSYIVEEAMDDQIIVFSEENYYMPEVVYKYYAEYGVSAQLSRRAKEERIGMYDYLKQFLDSEGVKLSNKDISYMRYRTLYLEYCAYGSIKALCKSFLYYLKGIDISLGIRGLELGRFVNAIKRKMKKLS